MNGCCQANLALRLYESFPSVHHSVLHPHPMTMAAAAILLCTSCRDDSFILHMNQILTLTFDLWPLLGIERNCLWHVGIQQTLKLNKGFISRLPPALKWWNVGSCTLTLHASFQKSRLEYLSVISLIKLVEQSSLFLERVRLLTYWRPKSNFYYKWLRLWEVQCWKEDPISKRDPHRSIPRYNAVVSSR